MADMHRLGDVGRAVVDDERAGRLCEADAEAFVLRHRLNLAGDPVVAQPQVDEPRPGDLGLLEEFACRQAVDDLLGHVARLVLFLRQAHGAVRLVVAVLGILGRLDHGHGPLDIGGVAGERLAELVLHHVEQIHGNRTPETGERRTLVRRLSGA